MFAGSAQKLKGTKTVEGKERLNVETCRPHAAIPSLYGVLEASLDARDCGCREVVCICTEASELPDLLTEEGKTFCCCFWLWRTAVQPCCSIFVLWAVGALSNEGCVSVWRWTSDNRRGFYPLSFVITLAATILQQRKGSYLTVSEDSWTAKTTEILYQDLISSFPLCCSCWEMTETYLLSISSGLARAF